jgi:hypothetical protein
LACLLLSSSILPSPFYSSSLITIHLPAISLNQNKSAYIICSLYNQPQFPKVEQACIVDSSHSGHWCNSNGLRNNLLIRFLQNEQWLSALPIRASHILRCIKMLHLWLSRLMSVRGTHHACLNEHDSITQSCDIRTLLEAYPQTNDDSTTSPMILSDRSTA